MVSFAAVNSPEERDSGLMLRRIFPFLKAL
jgi:hypothetical protein